MEQDLDGTFDLTTTAIELAVQGISIFPCRSSGRSKTPYIKFTKEATTDIPTIKAWWKRWPSALIAIPTGKINGITVLDIDKKNGVDGFQTLRQLGIDIDAISGLHLKTPSGGRHIYFEYSSSEKNSAGKLGPGLDVRNDGGYVIFAGEIPGQGRYEMVRP